MKLELWGGRRDDDPEPNYASRWGRLVVPDRLRGVTKHARRLAKIGLVSGNSAEISVCKDRDLDAATRDAPGIDHRCSRGRRDGDFGQTAGAPRRDGDFGRTAGTPRRYGQSGALTCRQERNGTACHAWRANQRGGPPPGKRWRYRDGQCTLDVQLYPDVQTKQFGTLAYEVKSDDNTDEGKRVCLAQLQSRAQTRH